MRKPLLFALSLACVSALMIFQSNSGGPASVGGTNATGSPGGGTPCTSCHAGGSFGTMSLDLELRTDTGTVVAEYVPGYVYEVSLTVNNTSGTPSGFGSQTLPLLVNGDSMAGVFSNPSANAQLSTVGNRTFLEQLSISNSNEFTATWRAPAPGSGDVTFYMAGNAVNGNGTTGGDNAATGNVLVPEVVTDSTDGIFTINHYQSLDFYPNPAIDVVRFNSELSAVSIYDMTGKLVRIANIENGKINVKDLEVGMYLLEADGKVSRLVKR